MTDRERIECKVAPWYYRRMGLMVLLLVGCGCWFLWDGMVGWPKGNQKADIYEGFQAGRDGETPWGEFVAEKEEKDWADVKPGEEALAAIKEAYEAAAGGETWNSFSVARRLPEAKPKRHPQSAIEGQYHWAYGAFIIGGGVLIVMLINAPKKLTADGEAFYTPGNVRVPFDRIFKVDKKKWDNKGLAYTYFKDEGEKVKKATIDDLKFKGADKILDRVLARFEGELIERAAVDDDEYEDDDEDEDGEERAGGEGVSDESKEGSEKASQTGGSGGLRRG